MLVQFLSDTHDAFPKVEAKGDILVLLGDIGEPSSRAYRDFITSTSEMFQDVIVLMGNHEVYNKTRAETEALIQDACRHSNTHFLNKSSVTINGINFAGATLWSDIDDFSVNRINCFRKIYEDGPLRKKLQKETYLQWFREEKQFLLDQSRIPNTVLLSHYAPLMECNDPYYTDSPIKSGFSSHLPELFTANVKAYLFGHTHINGTWNCNGVPIYSNCKGYFAGESRGPRFDPNKTIHITISHETSLK